MFLRIALEHAGTDQVGGVAHRMHERLGVVDDESPRGDSLLQPRHEMLSVTFTNTKSSKARTVPISPELESFLRNHWKRHGPFTGAITSFRRALTRSGINLPKGQASHALRHSFASHFIQKGGNILTLQKILGHSSLAMTMRYAHLAPDHLKDAIRFAPIARII